MRSWHPLSKLTVVIGLFALALVWWLDHASPGDAREAGAVASSNTATAATVRRASAPLLWNPSEPEHAIRRLPPVDDFASMVDRPLFAPARRPPEPEPVVADLTFSPSIIEPAAPPALPSVSFVGSIEESGRVRALLGNGSNVRGVGLGEMVEGWTVLDIEPRRLILGLDDEILELRILE